jgi:hypothetical protein
MQGKARVSGVVLVFAAAYVVMTAADMVTTQWGLAAGQGFESNHSVSDGAGGLDLQRFLALNAVVLCCTAGMLAWALRNRDVVNPVYLRQPARALFSWFHLNPFSKKVMANSVFAYIALAPGIILFKAFAAINNWLIASDIPDVVTPIAHLLYPYMHEVIAYWILIFILAQPIWLASLHLAAWFLRRVPVSKPAAGADARQGV